jgi:hypothetical protein
LAAAADVSADEPTESAAAEAAPAAPDLADNPPPQPAADPPPPAAADAAASKQPKSSALPAPIKTNREAIALLYGFAFGLALIAISLVARFRRDMFGRSAG